MQNTQRPKSAPDTEFEAEVFSFEDVGDDGFGDDQSENSNSSIEAVQEVPKPTSKRKRIAWHEVIVCEPSLIKKIVKD